LPLFLLLSFAVFFPKKKGMLFMAEDNEALGPVDVFMISLAFFDLILAE